MLNSKTLSYALVLLVVSVLVTLTALTTLRDNRLAAELDPGPGRRPVVFIPGVLGSMLCHGDSVVWGTVDVIGQFPSLDLATSGDIEPCGLIREISFLGVYRQTVYGPFMDRLEAAGYEQGKTLFVFDYDWRLSVFDNAKRLAAFVDDNIPAGQRFDIIAHSMGGLIARTYAAQEGGAARIDRLVSAGSPWFGSVQVFDLLRNGWGLATPIMGGVEGIRRTILSFPSMLELMPQYDGCCTDPADPTRFDTASPDAWLALNWPGIDLDHLPDLADAARRQIRLHGIFEQPLPGGIEEALVIGVDQRTPQRFELALGEGEAALNLVTSWDGDSVVMRDSAQLKNRIVYPTSFATHDAILSDKSVQDFVLATLARGPDVASKLIPIRARGTILTKLGDLVELVGAAVDTDQPIYAMGTNATAIVHLRLGVDTPVDPSSLTLTVTTPDGLTRPIALSAARGLSDPANPLEQSFAGPFNTGMSTGELTLALTIDDKTADPRVVTRIMPVVAS
jgi:pimeloyl-ACP methyl ester carboxylesterase